MKYEVIESGEAWIVRSEGEELARFERQSEALDHVAVRLRDADAGQQAVSLQVRYQPRD